MGGRLARLVRGRGYLNKHRSMLAHLRAPATPMWRPPLPEYTAPALKRSQSALYCHATECENRPSQEVGTLTHDPVTYSDL